MLVLYLEMIMIRRLYFVVGLILGFVACAHWDWGRDFVQDISPIYTKKITKGMEKIKEGVEKTGSNLEKKVHQALQ